MSFASLAPGLVDPGPLARRFTAAISLAANCYRAPSAAPEPWRPKRGGGIMQAELEHAVESEDALTAEDFLLRRTKFWLTLAPASRASVAAWFERLG